MKTKNTNPELKVSPIIFSAAKQSNIKKYVTKEMAVCNSLSLSVLYDNSVPKFSSNPSQTRAKVLMKLKAIASTPTKLYGRNSGKSCSHTKINAGLSAIEPNPNEDPVDRWRTNGVDPVPSPSTSSLFLFRSVCDSFWFFLFFWGVYRRILSMGYMMGTTRTTKPMKQKGTTPYNFSEASVN